MSEKDGWQNGGPSVDHSCVNGILVLPGCNAYSEDRRVSAAYIATMRMFFILHDIFFFRFLPTRMGISTDIQKFMHRLIAFIASVGVRTFLETEYKHLVELFSADSLLGLPYLRQSLLPSPSYPGNWDRPRSSSWGYRSRRAMKYDSIVFPAPTSAAMYSSSTFRRLHLDNKDLRQSCWILW